MLSFPEFCNQCGEKWFFNHECSQQQPRRPWVASCHRCRQAWDGTTAPASLLCPECGEMMEIEDD